jgi:superfamily II DNA/RNA helicase
MAVGDAAAKNKNGSFATLGDLLRPELLEGVNRLGYTSMSDIQAKALPHALAGRDVIGQAVTGSGKTAVFGLAALQRLDLTAAAAAAAAGGDGVAVEAGRPQILVMCPTRELAAQLATALRKLAVGLPGSVRVVALVGGADSRAQRVALTSKGAAVHAVVGTPGRLRAHLESGALDLSQVKWFYFQSVVVTFRRESKWGHKT